MSELGWTVAVDAFLSARDLAPTTRRSYRQTLDRIGGLLGPERPVHDLDAGDVADLHATAYADVGPATWNRTVATVETFLRWLGRQGWTTRGTGGRFADLAERRRVPAQPPRAVEYATLERLWLRSDVPLRERTLWRMLYETAARAEEVLSLNIEDLDLPNRRANTIRKGGGAAVIDWSTGTARLLPRLIKGRKTGPLFLSSNPRQETRVAPAADTCPVTGLSRLSYRRAAELFTGYSGGLTLHQLRHSAIVDLLEAGYSTPVVMAKSGHQSLRAFQTYARPSARAVAAMTADLDDRRRGR